MGFEFKKQKQIRWSEIPVSKGDGVAIQRLGWLLQLLQPE